MQVPTQCPTCQSPIHVNYDLDKLPVEAIAQWVINSPLTTLIKMQELLAKNGVAFHIGTPDIQAQYTYEPNDHYET